MLGDQGLQKRMPRAVEHAPPEQDAPQRFRLVGDPGAKRRDQCVPVDKAILERQQAKQQVPASVRCTVVQGG